MSTARMNPLVRPGSQFRYLPEDDPYPFLRTALAPEYAALPFEELEDVLAGNGIRAEDMESFLGDVGGALSGAAKDVAPVAAKALPGVISGAAAGCALGPWGCLGGAIIGGVGAALSGGGGKSSHPAAGPSSPVSSIAGAVPAIASAVGGGGGAASVLASALPAIAGLAAPAGAPAPAGTAAPAAGAKNPAGVLLGLLQQPQFLQALMSMALGSAGKKEVQVGDASVPTSAFANLASVLASKAFSQAEAAADPSEDLPDYLYTQGTLTLDPAVPSQRAARLLQMLGEVSIPAPRVTRFLNTEADEYYDALDIAELDWIETEGNDLEFDD